jgi:hypothetical protein
MLTDIVIVLLSKRKTQSKDVSEQRAEKIFISKKMKIRGRWSTY